MALSDILEKIKKEAEARIQELEKVFQSNLQELKDEYTRKQAKIENEIKEKAETNSQTIIEKAESLAKMEEKNALLAAKRKILETAFSQAIEKLTNSNDYERLLVRLLERAKQETGDQGEIVPAKGKEDITKKAITLAQTKFQIARESGEFKGGFIVRNKTIEINNSFESIINRELRDGLEPTVAQILFS